MTTPLPLYRNNATGRTVEAVKYQKNGMNAAFVRSFLDARAQYVSAWTDTHTHMGGPRYDTICFDHTPGSTLYVNPGNVVLVYTDNRQPDVFTPELFSQYFTEVFPTTPKETPVTEPTEYDAHREEVLDALAVLRVATPGENAFELATNEIMSLLADAFNDGWSTGIQHAQVNPFVDWE